jgi:hypothetical protein
MKLDSSPALSKLQIVDQSLNVWTLSGGKVFENAKLAGFSANVSSVIYDGGKIYQQAGTGFWAWDGTSWGSAVPDPRKVSANGASISPGAQLVDADLNIWIIDHGVVYENGLPAGATADVVALYYYDGTIYQKNTQDKFYAWNGSSWPITSPPPGASTAPPMAVAVGYNVKTLSSTFTPTEVDLANTKASGFKWYLWEFFNPSEFTTPNQVQLNPDKSVTLNGGASRNGNIASIIPAKNTAGYTGTAFGGGGYFEATMKFDPKTVVTSNGWPAWWSLSLEMSLGLPGSLWPGQSPGYRHGVEADFFEYDLGQEAAYGGSMHDWYGVYGTTCKGYCGVSLTYGQGLRRVPADTAFTDYHRYGYLWVPATETTDGYAQYYFDGVQVGGTTSWTKYADQAPKPESPWTFSILDKEHLILILGTGVNQPMTVQSVNVWQQSSGQNLTQ